MKLPTIEAMEAAITAEFTHRMDVYRELAHVTGQIEQSEALRRYIDIELQFLSVPAEELGFKEGSKEDMRRLYLFFAKCFLLGWRLRGAAEAADKLKRRTEGEQGDLG